MDLLLSGERLMLISISLYMNTDGLMKLIKSLSDMAVRSCVVGEKG